MKCCTPTFHHEPTVSCLYTGYLVCIESWNLTWSWMVTDTSIPLLLLLLHISSSIPLPPSYTWPWIMCLQHQDTTIEQKTNKGNNNLWHHLLGTSQWPVLLFFSCVCLDYCFVWLVCNYWVNCSKLNFCQTAVFNGNYLNSKILEPKVPLLPWGDYRENSTDWPTISWEGHYCCNVNYDSYLFTIQKPCAVYLLRKSK